MNPLPIAVLVGAAPYERDLIGALAHPASGAQVVVRALDENQLLESLDRVRAVVLAGSPTPQLVQACRASEVKLVCIGGRTEVRGVHLVPQSADLISSVLIGLGLRAELGRAGPNLAPLIAVVGFGGGAGRTTTVRELAWHWRNEQIVVVDADTYGPSVQLAFGSAAGPSILDLMRAIETQRASGYPLPSQFGVHVVAGLAANQHWAELRAPALNATWHWLRSTHSLVVADCGPQLEVDPVVAQNATIPRRHAAPVSAVGQASKVLLCARPDRTGLTRLMRGYQQHASLFDDTEIVVVLTGVVPSGAIAEQVSAIREYLGINQVQVIPHDDKVMSQADESATCISAVDGDSPVALAYAKLAALVGPKSQVVTAGATRRWPLRRSTAA